MEARYLIPHSTERDQTRSLSPGISESLSALRQTCNIGRTTHSASRVLRQCLQEPHTLELDLNQNLKTPTQGQHHA